MTPPPPRLSSPRWLDIEALDRGEEMMTCCLSLLPTPGQSPGQSAEEFTWTVGFGAEYLIGGGLIEPLPFLAVEHWELEVICC